MKIIKKDLVIGRWKELDLVTQMANIGSEVERTISWRDKGNKPYSQKAFYRSLELIDLTIESPENRARARMIRKIYPVIYCF